MLRLELLKSYAPRVSARRSSVIFAGTAILVLGMEQVKLAIVTIREYGFLRFGYGAVAICRRSIWFGWARVVLPPSIS